MRSRSRLQQLCYNSHKYSACVRVWWEFEIVLYIEFDGAGRRFRRQPRGCRTTGAATQVSQGIVMWVDFKI